MENKFTDNEIMKVLECCFSNDFDKCEDCPLKSNLDEVFSCMRLKQELAIDLITRQKAEIERLNVELVGMRGACESYKIHYDNAKAEIAELQRQLQEGIDLSDTVLKIVKSEARKEFAEKVKPILREMFDLMMDDDEGKCIVANCKKHSSIPCMNEYCIKENREAWETKVDNLVKEMEGKDHGRN